MNLKLFINSQYLILIPVKALSNENDHILETFILVKTSVTKNDHTVSFHMDKKILANERTSIIWQLLMVKSQIIKFGSCIHVNSRFSDNSKIFIIYSKIKSKPDLYFLNFFSSMSCNRSSVTKSKNS